MNGDRFLSNWLIPIQSSGEPKLRIFCFPYAGASARVFRSWRDAFPETVDVVGIELPGHGSRFNERLRTDLSEIVEEVATVILPHLDVPYAIFGHSMGAILAYEVSLFLWKKFSVIPVHIFVSGHTSLQRPSGEAPIFDLAIREFLAELERLNGIPPQFFEDEELITLFTPVLRADIQACETYIYSAGAPLPASLSVFGGIDDPKVMPEELSYWAELATGHFSIRLFEGDHFFLHSAEVSVLDSVKSQLLPYL